MTGFLDAFVYLGDGTTRMKDLPTSVVALLVLEACNIGLALVVNPGYEALTRAWLVHVDQYYLRADTIAAANARLIAVQACIPIVCHWGDGLLASVGGLRFQVPRGTINAVPSPKYFRVQAWHHLVQCGQRRRRENGQTEGGGPGQAGAPRDE
ncbi:transposase [Streptomyces sudanensis]|nr:transposase [Streptomyces sudanensis]MCP9985321.1 transposase [Streptomyces sudanensis]